MAREASNKQGARQYLKSRKRAVRQMQDRRKESLMKKAYEYSKMCGADVCLGIRLRDSGRVFTFMADASGFWSKFDTSLVRKIGVSHKSMR
jgi:hypothetical protein